MRLQRRSIETDHPNREMVHVAPRRVERLMGRDRGRDQIDQRGAGAQLNQPRLLQFALDLQAQDGLIKLDRPFEAADPKHHVVEPADTDRSLGLGRCGGVDRC